MLTKQRVQEIKSIADKLLNKSLNDIAKENEIKVVTWELPKIQKREVSWAIIKRDDWKFTIYINSKDSKERRRFTFAHELWHFFLHRKILEEKSFIFDENDKYLYRGDEEYQNLDESRKQIEYEANEFAGALLMPEETVLKFLDKMTNPEMAEIFGVSDFALSVRIYNLTARKYE